MCRASQCPGPAWTGVKGDWEGFGGLRAAVISSCRRGQRVSACCGSGARSAWLGCRMSWKARTWFYRSSVWYQLSNSSFQPEAFWNTLCSLSRGHEDKGGQSLLQALLLVLSGTYQPQPVRWGCVVANSLQGFMVL